LEAAAVQANSPRIVVVEDDTSLARAIRVGLRNAGYEVDCYTDGVEIKTHLARFKPDLALLDVRLPIGPDGFEIARTVRATVGCPIMFLTASDELDQRLTGFDAGADDYVVKPVALAELLARIRAVLRRSGRLVSPVFEVRDLIIDERTRSVTRSGRAVDLSPTEFNLLCVLAREPGRVFSKLQLLSLVWGFDEYDPNLVEVYVSSLRRKLGADGSVLIRTERGEGYVFRD
jgi:DNA-binding response OmpR family regulator